MSAQPAGPSADLPTVTVEQVLEFAPCPDAVAQKIATYTTLRAQGVRPVDASREVGADWPQTHGTKYERWALALQEKLGLPEFSVPAFYSPSRERAQASGRRGGLAKGHASHVQVVPGCPRCSSGARPVGGGS